MNRVMINELTFKNELYKVTDDGLFVKFYYKIEAFIQDTIVGFMKITEKCFRNSEKPEVEVTYLHVYDSYGNTGIAKLLYIEFGKMYKEKFNGYKLFKKFINPIAEYIFRKSIANGHIPENALQEENIMRFYHIESEQNLFNILLNKLPDKVKPRRISYIF